MLSINTNISSLIAQSSMKTSSQLLNQAVERMTTGSKINHASDNAANYSISTNMTTKIGAYMVAEDNVLSGMDLINTATEVIQMMEDRASRLSALSIQARNGTYGAKSLGALNAEAGALVSEIARLYNSTQFNNVNLFNRTSFTLDENLPQAGESGFIDETALISAASFDESLMPTAKAEYGGFIANPYTYTADQVADMTALTDDVTTITSGEKYSISDVDELINLRELVNSGVGTTGAIFVLGADIDLSSVANWTPIGTDVNQFKGEFDGNGHYISNLTINKNSDLQGLFGCSSATSLIKNTTLESINIIAKNGIGALIGKAYGEVQNCVVKNVTISGLNALGGLLGRTYGSIKDCYAQDVNIISAGSGVGYIVGGLVSEVEGDLENCYTSGNVDCKTVAGGLAARVYGNVQNCYSTVNVKGGDYTGGLIGGAHGEVSNCWASGNVDSYTGTYLGGLIALSHKKVESCYAMGDVVGKSCVGGLIGETGQGGEIIDCYATGNVEGSADRIGGLVGRSYVPVTNCYATGNVFGFERVGGLVGAIDANIVNSYATGNVEGSEYTGGLIGTNANTSRTIINCYTLGNVVGVTYTGGLVGNAVCKIEDCYSSGNVFSTGEYAGGIAGYSGIINNCYSTGSVKGTNIVGGLVGHTRSTLTTCYSTGNVNGENFVGGLVGQAYKVSGTLNYTECHAYGQANGSDGVGGLIGGAVLTTNGTNFGKINTVDCQAASQGAGSIGGVYQYDSATATYTLLSTYDKSSMNSGIKEFKIMPTTTTLHLGINGNNSSSLSFDTNFVFDFSPMNSSVDSEEFSQSVNSFVKQLQEKTTILGAVQNRLESVLDEITIQYENLVSSRSTIRDADIADVSSTYIQQQILQQAAATLMSTANQSPSIALQLI